MRAAIAGTLTASLLVFGVAPAEAARTCTSIKPQDHPVIGGQQVDVYVTAERCGASLYVVDVEAASWDGPGYGIRSVEVWRYRYAASKGAVRSASIPARAGVRVTHRVPVGRTIPARTRGTGWSGFVRVAITTGGEAKTINLML